MYEIGSRVGRLIEMRVWSPVTAEELPGFAGKLGDSVKKPVGKVVIACNLVGCSTFPPELADKFTGMMKGDNPKLERSAFLLTREGGSVFQLQVERMIREAGNPVRRTFRDPEVMAGWLGEVLSPLERARVRGFLQLPPTGR